MKSYEIINEVSSKLYINVKNEEEVVNRLENSIDKIQSQFSDDFKALFGYELNLEDFYIHFDDEAYRQSATVLILNMSVINHSDFKIRVELLIDHQRIWIKITNGKQISDFIEIVSKIENVQNSEGLSELKEIK